MMMTATPHDSVLLHSPTLSAAMDTLSVKRPSLSPLKRKRSEEDTTSPTSIDELMDMEQNEGRDECTMSPSKKTKHMALDCANWIGALELDELVLDDAGSDEACMKVLEAYAPVAFDATPAEPLDEQECEILTFFLS